MSYQVVQLTDTGPRKRYDVLPGTLWVAKEDEPSQRLVSSCLSFLVRYVSCNAKPNKACNSCSLQCRPCYHFLEGQSNLTSWGNCSHELQKSIGRFSLDDAARQSINKLLARTMFQRKIIHITSWWTAQLHWRLRKCCPVFLAQCRRS